MNVPPKFVTILCLLQFFFVTMGFFLTRGFLKIFNQISPDLMGSHPSVVPPTSRFVNACGLWFLLIPLAWCFVAALRGEVNRGVASISQAQLIVGIVLTVSLTFVFSYSALSAFYLASSGPY